jgi:hypothetical protein
VWVGRCAPFDQKTDVSDLRGVYIDFSNRRGPRYTACALAGFEKVLSKGLSHYVQGGPIPGVGTLKGMKIEEVGYDPSTDNIIA